MPAGWSMRTRDGQPMVWQKLAGVTDGPSSWRWIMPCINSAYRAHSLRLIREIAAGYPLNGLFLDIFEMAFSARFLCFCKACRSHYRSCGLDLDDPAAAFECVREREKTWAGFLGEVRAVLDAARPGMSLSMNGGPLMIGPSSLMQTDGTSLFVADSASRRAAPIVLPSGALGSTIAVKG